MLMVCTTAIYNCISSFGGVVRTNFKNKKSLKDHNSVKNHWICDRWIDRQTENWSLYVATTLQQVTQEFDLVGPSYIQKCAKILGKFMITTA